VSLDSFLYVIRNSNVKGTVRASHHVAEPRCFELCHPSTRCADPSSRFAGLMASRSPNRWTTPLKKPKTASPDTRSKTENYLTSLCPVCLRHVLQNFRVSTRSECFFLFLVVV